MSTDPNPKPIVKLGHPALRAPARALTQEDLAHPELQSLIDEMVETMVQAHGVGLAAPQVGVEIQLFVYQSAGPPEIPLHVVINPMLTPQSGEMVYEWEGCLSIPDLRGLVPRHPGVRIQGLDRDGAPLDYLASGFEARIVQHENDHLNGVVFLDRMRDLRSLTYAEELDRMLVGKSAELDETAVG